MKFFSWYESLVVLLFFFAFSYFCQLSHGSSTDYYFDAGNTPISLTVVGGNLRINQPGGVYVTATPAMAQMTSCVIRTAKTVSIDSPIVISNTGYSITPNRSTWLSPRPGTYPNFSILSYGQPIWSASRNINSVIQKWFFGTVGSPCSISLFAVEGITVNSDVTANGVVTLATDIGSVHGLGQIHSTGTVFIYDGRPATISTSSGNILVTCDGTDTAIVSSSATLSSFALSSPTITEAAAFNIGSTALTLAATGNVNLPYAITADGGVTLETTSGTINGPGAVNSTGKIVMRYLGGQDVTFGVGSGNVQLTDGVGTVTIGTTPASISSLQIEGPNTLATTTAVDIGSGKLILQATTSITYNNDLTANGGIWLNSVGTKSGSGVLTGTVTSLP